MLPATDRGWVRGWQGCPAGVGGRQGVCQIRRPGGWAAIAAGTAIAGGVWRADASLGVDVCVSDGVLCSGRAKAADSAKGLVSAGAFQKGKRGSAGVVISGCKNCKNCTASEALAAS